MSIAGSPPDELASHYEQQNEIMSWICNTCWQSVVQECILGIWKHVDKSRNFNCTKLVPIRRNEVHEERRWKCEHDFEKVEGLDGVKCIKCGLPEFWTHFTGYDATKRARYFCKECNVEFKLLGKHYEGKHKRKIFAYRELKN